MNMEFKYKRKNENTYENWNNQLGFDYYIASFNDDYEFINYLICDTSVIENYIYNNSLTEKENKYKCYEIYIDDCKSRYEQKEITEITNESLIYLMTNEDKTLRKLFFNLI